jgi:DNA-binding MarR family transcriptional regulator
MPANAGVAQASPKRRGPARGRGGADEQREQSEERMAPRVFAPGTGMIAGVVTPPLRIDPIAEARRHWEARWEAEPSRAMAAVTSLMRAQQVLMARLNDLLRPHGLTFPRYEALMLLSFTRTGALPLGKIGERLQVHRTSVTNIIDKLEADGLVRRVPHAEDRRATLAEITEEGRATAKAATEVLNEECFCIAALAPRDLERLTAILRGLRLDAGDFTP